MRGSPAGAALLDGLYGVVTSPQAWPGFLEGLAELMRADAAVALLPDLEGRARGIFASARLGPETLELYARVAHLDEWVLRGRAWPVGTVMTGEDLIPADELSRSPFYRDFLRPAGLAHMCGIIPARQGRIMAMVNVQRSSRRGPFQGQQIEIMRFLAPHIRRVTLVQQELLRVRDAGAAPHAGLDALLGHAGGRTSKEAPRGFAATPGEPRRHLGVSVMPPHSSDAARTLAPGLARPTTLVVTKEPEAASPLPTAARMRAVHGLTPAEARLAGLLADGRNGPAAAAELGVSPNTIKTHLRAIFCKTGTHRQAALVRLLLASGGSNIG